MLFTHNNMKLNFNWFTYFVVVNYTACTHIVHRKIFEMSKKYFTKWKYFTKYFTPKKIHENHETLHH